MDNDKSILEKFTDAVKDIASTATEAASQALKADEPTSRAGERAAADVPLAVAPPSRKRVAKARRTATVARATKARARKSNAAKVSATRVRRSKKVAGQPAGRKSTGKKPSSRKPAGRSTTKSAAKAKKTTKKTT